MHLLLLADLAAGSYFFAHLLSVRSVEIDKNNCLSYKN